jgi:hypothetical protein
VTNAAYFFLSSVWVSVVALVAFYLVQRSPKRRKPVDELEAADAALRNRMVDLEDKYESFVKRLAVRDMRNKKEEGSNQIPLSLDRRARLTELRARLAAKREQGGAV